MTSAWALGVFALLTCAHALIAPSGGGMSFLLGAASHTAMPNGKGFDPTSGPLATDNVQSRSNAKRIPVRLSDAEQIEEMEADMMRLVSNREERNPQPPRAKRKTTKALHEASTLFTARSVFSDEQIARVVNSPRSLPSTPAEIPNTGHQSSHDVGDHETHPPAADAIQSKVHYRLRPPSPVDPALKEQERQCLLAKERQTSLKKQLKKIQDKQGFFPYSLGPSDPSQLSNTDQNLAEDNGVFSSRSFQELGVSDLTVLDNLAAMRLSIPTLAQAVALPALSQGESIVLHAHTGSGKTLAYLLPLLSLVNSNQRSLQAVVLVPGRELAAQIGKIAQQVFLNTNISVATLIGGANVQHQLKTLKSKRPQLVVATPGRLAEVVFKLQALSLRGVHTMILDEADSLLQPLFCDEVRTIMDDTVFRPRPGPSAPAVQVALGDGKAKPVLCLASATAKDSAVVKQFVEHYGPDCRHVSPETTGMLPRTITHALMSCARIQMFETLKRLLRSQPEVRRALVFVNDPHRVKVVCDALMDKGIVAAPLHGDASKDDRKEIMARVRDGRLNVVVTTELAARGLDIPDLSHVLNLDLPTDGHHYVHRAGRCGRAGRPGLVISLATPTTKFVMRRFGKHLGIKIHDCELRAGCVYLRRP